MSETAFVDIKRFCVFAVWNFVANEKSRFENVDLYGKAGVPFVRVGSGLLRAGPRAVGRRVLAASPATKHEHSHIHYVVTVISIVGARVKFRRAVPVSLC
jgi:hypothetical protein